MLIPRGVFERVTGSRPFQRARRNDLAGQVWHATPGYQRSDGETGVAPAAS
jgi:hypothetical protein